MSHNRGVPQRHSAHRATSARALRALCVLMALAVTATTVCGAVTSATPPLGVVEAHSYSAAFASPSEGHAIAVEAGADAYVRQVDAVVTLVFEAREPAAPSSAASRLQLCVYVDGARWKASCSMLHDAVEWPTASGSADRADAGNRTNWASTRRHVNVDVRVPVAGPGCHSIHAVLRAPEADVASTRIHPAADGDLHAVAHADVVVQVVPAASGAFNTEAHCDVPFYVSGPLVPGKHVPSASTAQPVGAESYVIVLSSEIRELWPRFAAMVSASGLCVTRANTFVWGPDAGGMGTHEQAERTIRRMFGFPRHYRREIGFHSGRVGLREFAALLVRDDAPDYASRVPEGGSLGRRPVNARVFDLVERMRYIAASPGVTASLTGTDGAREAALLWGDLSVAYRGTAAMEACVDPVVVELHASARGTGAMCLDVASAAARIGVATGTETVAKFSVTQRLSVEPLGQRRGWESLEQALQYLGLGVVYALVGPVEAIWDTGGAARSVQLIVADARAAWILLDAEVAYDSTGPSIRDGAAVDVFVRLQAAHTASPRDVPAGASWSACAVAGVTCVHVRLWEAPRADALVHGSRADPGGGPLVRALAQRQFHARYCWLATVSPESARVVADVMGSLAELESADAARPPTDAVAEATAAASPRRPVIISAAYSMEWPRLNVFVHSLRRTGYTGDVVMLMHAGISDETARNFRKYGVTHVAVTEEWPYFTDDVLASPGGSLPGSLERLAGVGVKQSRYLMAHEWLLKHVSASAASCEGARYTHVLLADSADVLFQADPFEWEKTLGANGALSHDGLYAFEEHRIGERLSDGESVVGQGDAKAGMVEVTMASQPHNLQFMAAFDERARAQLAPLPVLCSGTTFGSLSRVLWYLRQMRTRIAQWHEGFAIDGSDQGVHNYVMRLDAAAHAAAARTTPPHIVRNGEGAVRTLAVEVFRAQERPLEHVLPVDPLGRVLTDAGYPVPVVHQYNRHTELVELANRWWFARASDTSV